MADALLVGGGNMGRALLRGWGSILSSVTIVDPSPLQEIKNNYAIFNDLDHVPDDRMFDVIILAVKPQIFPDILPKLKRYVRVESFFLSIAAGKTTAAMEVVLGKAAIIRAMPNTPAMIGQGMTVCIANYYTETAQKDLAQNLLAATGDVVWIMDEGQMHAVTALSGSGPAYVFALIEAMQQAGENLGLASDLAARLARQTVQGAAALAAQSDQTPEQLRQQVTSPGGTTAAALEVLQAADGLKSLMKRALAAAVQRSEELSS